MTATPHESPERDALTDENTSLRAIIARCCNALPNGAYCKPDATLDFMEGVPDEVLLVTSRLVAEVASLRQSTEAALTAQRVAERERDEARDIVEAARAYFEAIDAVHVHSGHPIRQFSALTQAVAEKRRALRAALSQEDTHV